MRLWPEDTIAWRFAMTIVLAIVGAVGLAALVSEFAGPWARPPARELGLLERADDIVRMVEATPAARRQALLNAAGNSTFQAAWYSPVSTVAMRLNSFTESGAHAELPGFQTGDHQRRLIRFAAVDHADLAADLHFGGTTHPYGFLAVELDDGSWVVFMAPHRLWGVGLTARIGFGLMLLVISIAAVSAVATYHLARPIRDFTDALRRFGTDPRAAPIPENGPREVRASIAAFNAMQAQIQRFVDDRNRDVGRDLARPADTADEDAVARRVGGR